MFTAFHSICSIPTQPASSCFETPKVWGMSRLYFCYLAPIC